ncbi:glycosyltransferase [Austwickia chelonae]|uniref:glycosyltransferase n=1 Tax=Austwickia chelonae TaxID=100225 RepID=UPI000E26BCB0|nr:glycosyltransferase [Austwickia chelonae]
MTPRLTLVLTMIVKDGARAIRRALDSAAPYVDRMIVVDTGSGDGTPEIARDAGAEVHHFPWVDDFSSARNHALDLADADWNLVLDSDEWIVHGGTSLAGLRHDHRRYVGSARCENIEDLTTGQITYAVNTIRILPRGVRYRFRIHEQPWHDLKAWPSPLVIAHDGYEPTLLEGKSGRNRILLEKQLQDTPDEPYYSFRYAEELRTLGEYDTAIPHFERGYRHGDPEAPWRHGLLLGYLGCLADAGRFTEALALAHAEMERWSRSPDLFFTLGNMLLDYSLAHPDKAAAHLPLIEASFRRCLEIGDRPELDNSLIGHGSFLAAHNLHAYYESIGDQDQAARAAALEVELRARAALTYGRAHQ